MITTAEQRVFNATEMERGKPVSGCHISRKCMPSHYANDSAAADCAAACGSVRAWKTLQSSTSRLQRPVMLQHIPADLGTRPAHRHPTHATCIRVPAHALLHECFMIMQGEITSRKQPGRGAKKTSEREIPIQAATAPDAAGAAEAEQGVPPLMSTQDYLEEAEELLAHPLDTTNLQTQPEVLHQQFL